jgi:hypothetical protein
MSASKPQSDEELMRPAPSWVPSPLRGEPSDRLTIRRLLLLTAGIAVGLSLFAPQLNEGNLANTEWWRITANAVVIGLALPAPLFCIPGAFRNRSLGPGGLFALAVGLGIFLMLPPAVLEWVARDTSSSNQRNTAAACLYYVLPLMGLWYLLAALVAGYASRRLFRPTTSWTERYGFFLALLWSPLGLWQVVDIYREVLHLG